MTTEESLWFRSSSESDRQVLALLEATCLVSCTTREVCDAGESYECTVVTPRWPSAGFSSGEKALWWLVTELLNGTLRDALSRLVMPDEKAALIVAVCGLMPQVPAHLLAAMESGASL